MTATFRSFLGDPGEPLLAPLTPQECAVRLAVFCASTGIDPNEVVYSPLCTTPLPLYPPQFPSGRRRWSGVRPDAMWHPLMWLPTRTAARVRTAVGDAEPALETDEQWASRVAIELTAAGLYNEVEGTWLDVLDLYGLDVEDSQTLVRIGAWLKGEPDPVLDTIDLTSHFGDADISWSVAAAWDATNQLRPLAWYLHAEELAEDGKDALANHGDLTDEELAATVRALSVLAVQSFDTLPPDALDGSRLVDPPPAEATRDHLLEVTLPSLVNVFTKIRDHYQDSYDAIVQLSRALDDDSSGSGWDGAPLQWGAPGA